MYFLNIGTFNNNCLLTNKTSDHSKCREHTVIKFIPIKSYPGR